MKTTGNKILDATIRSLQKSLGNPDIFSLGPGFERATPLTTSSTTLDAAIGLGGIPVGRVIEIFGPESSGKTSLALLILAQWFANRESLGQANRRAVWIDAEHATGNDMLKGFGIDADEVIWMKPKTSEQALNSIETLVGTGEIGLIVIDSVDALQTEDEIKREIGEESMGGGGLPKHLSKHLREVSKMAFDTNTTLIYLNQTRASMAMHGSPITTPGGNGLKFYSSLRLQTMPRQDSTTKGAFLMRVKIIKNKCAPPRKDPVEIDFLYAKGPEPYADIIMAAKEAGVIRFAGPSSKVKWYDADSEEALASGGAAGIKALLRAEPALFDRLRKSVFQAGGSSDVSNSDPEPDITEDESDLDP
jgi:recombination protein RecA